MANTIDPDDDMEEVTLLKVGMEDEDENDFGTMTLLDGRRLTINPGDISTAICWSPTASLQVVEANDDRTYDLIVKNQLYNQEIRARWI